MEEVSGGDGIISFARFRYLGAQICSSRATGWGLGKDPKNIAVKHQKPQEVALGRPGCTIGIPLRGVTRTRKGRQETTIRQSHREIIFFKHGEIIILEDLKFFFSAWVPAKMPR